MVSSDGIVKTTISMIRKLKPGYEVDLKTFKKDRGIEIVRTDDGHLFLIETGYENARCELDENSMSKIIKDAFYREFPRSHEVRYSTRKFVERKI
ncbi:MAG: hypothetical protein ACP5UV_02000 [Thermoplasmata archaeon]